MLAYRNWKGFQPQNEKSWVQRSRWQWRIMCKKDHVQKSRVQQTNHGSLKEFNPSMPQPVNTEVLSQREAAVRIRGHSSHSLKKIIKFLPCFTKLSLVLLAQPALGRGTWGWVLTKWVGNTKKIGYSFNHTTISKFRKCHKICIYLYVKKYMMLCNQMKTLR